MRASRCIERGAVAGSGSHQLNPTDRAVRGIVREAMNSQGSMQCMIRDRPASFVCASQQIKLTRMNFIRLLKNTKG